MTSIADLNELARERLARGADLYVACASSDDGVDAPSWALLRLDEPLIHRLLQVRSMCGDLDLWFASAKGGPTEYDGSGSELSSWSVRLNAQEFWLYGQARHGSVNSRAVSLEHLLAALGEPAVPLSAAKGDQGCVWFGGALVYEPETLHLDDFISLLEDERPELQAREREIEMAAALAARKSADGTSDTRLPRRRGLSV